jgi:asparagine synthase (glutamine-hydrolysing)
MCGIAGIISSDPWSDSLTAALTRMQAALRHRGPDDQGLWVDPVAGVGLAHTRLAILDLSPAGHQPMASADGRYQIVFNGEIYNFRELRASLEQEGVSFQTETDTEVLLQLFQQDGAAMLPKLRGMFAFCIWDRETKEAFLARDPLGIKPLYYSLQGEGFQFASELQALQQAHDQHQPLDAQTVCDFLTQGSVPEPATLLQSMRQLPAGHYAQWRVGRFVSQAYWQPFQTKTTQDAQPTKSLRAALLDTVEAHFVSDVPVGLFLSGGIDSTALLGLASALGKTDLQTFSIGVDQHDLDESSLAKRTAHHFGSRHHQQTLDANSAQALFHQFLQHGDQPSVDGFNSFVVSALARAHGMKVVLSGLGGDELFGGYPSFTKVPQMATWLRRLQRLPLLPHALGTRVEQRSAKSPLQRIGALLQQPVSPTACWRAFRGLMTPSQALGVLDRLGLRLEQPNTKSIPASEPWPDSTAAWLNEVSRLEITSYMRNQLLRDSDVMSMAHGLELRVPLVDRVLLERVLQMPPQERCLPGKAALIQAVPEIPKWVLEQRKRGFTFPYQRWLESDWSESLKQSDPLLPMKNPTWYQRWAVFMLWRSLEKQR